MYGQYGTFIAQPGQRDRLVAYLLQAADGLRLFEGCYLYVVSTIPTEEDAIHIMEVWRSKEAHHASLELEATRQLITLARPLIAEIKPGIELVTLGGKGLS